MVLKINKNKLQNLIEDTYRNYLFNIEKIIDYTPPKYDPNWNKKFKQVDKSTWIPDKKKGHFKFSFKKNNLLKLDNNVTGVYLIIGDEIKFFYTGYTKNNLVQRFITHIQKITATNLGRWYTPKKWQPFIIKRYEVMKNRSVLLNDIKLSYFHSNNFIKILNNENYPEIELEAAIFYYFKKKFNNSIILNTTGKISNKIYRDKYKNYW